ncbi:hypothetical protein OROHE_005956 [Orobanche hederae]
MIDIQISAVRHSHRLAKAISRLTSSHTVPKLRLQCNPFTHSSGKAQESVHTELIEVDKDVADFFLFLNSSCTLKADSGYL